MSFKRKISSTRPSSSPSPATLLSTGIPSLDDILGGGLPLSCSLVLTAPDVHTEYGDLVQKYFVAQGLASRQRVCVVGSSAWVDSCMWLSAGPTANADDEARPSDEKIKIAWRYEQMKPFQTTVADAATFDLSVRIPSAVVQDALADGRLLLVPTEAPGPVLERLGAVLAAHTDPLRICISSLGSPHWGDLGSQDILRFLHGLRGLVRRYAHACASTNLTAEMSADVAGWHQKLGWVSDGAITMAAFAADPALAAAFPTLHGLVRIHTLPAPRGLVPASDRFSTLRGAAAGGGENNLGFKSTRKRLVFETLHLDVEGGVSERRTTAPVTSGESAIALAPREATGAAVKIEVEGLPTEEAAPKITKKAQKKVGFQSDRPEVYDF